MRRNMSKLKSSLNLGKQILGKKGSGGDICRTAKQNASAATELAYPDEETNSDHVIAPNHVTTPDHIARMGMDTVKRSKLQDSVKPFDSIPQTSALPYIGALWQYKFGEHAPQQYHKSLLEKYRKHGAMFRETIGGDTIVHMFRPLYARQVFAEGGDMPFIPPLLEPLKRYRATRNIGLGLGNTNGAEWQALRSRVNKLMLHRRAVTAYLPHVNAVLDEYLARLPALLCPHTAQLPHINRRLVQLTMEVAGYTTFEKRLGLLCEDHDPALSRLIHANDQLFDSSTELKFSMKWYNLSPHLSLAWRRLVTAEDVFMKFVFEATSETVAAIEEQRQAGTLTQESFPFFLSLLACDLSSEDVYVMALSMFSDGLTSIAPTMAYLLHLLASHPDKQARLHQEITAILPADKYVSAAVLSRATYLKACIKETFRLYPVQPDISRIAKEDTTIGGYKIPKGTQLQLNMGVLLRSEEYFQRPDEFIPERWVRGPERASADPFMLLPFSHGVRMCIGRRVAEQEIQVHVMKLLDQYQLCLHEKETIEQDFYMLFRPNKDTKVRFIHR